MTNRDGSDPIDAAIRAAAPCVDMSADMEFLHWQGAKDLPPGHFRLMTYGLVPGHFRPLSYDLEPVGRISDARRGQIAKSFGADRVEIESPASLVVGWDAREGAYPAPTVPFMNAWHGEPVSSSPIGITTGGRLKTVDARSVTVEAPYGAGDPGVINAVSSLIMAIRASAESPVNLLLVDPSGVYDSSHRAVPHWAHVGTHVTQDTEIRESITKLSRLVNARARYAYARGCRRLHDLDSLGGPVLIVINGLAAALPTPKDRSEFIQITRTMRGLGFYLVVVDDTTDSSTFFPSPPVTTTRLAYRQTDRGMEPLYEDDPAWTPIFDDGTDDGAFRPTRIYGSPRGHLDAITIGSLSSTLNELITVVAPPRAPRPPRPPRPKVLRGGRPRVDPNYRGDGK